MKKTIAAVALSLVIGFVAARSMNFTDRPPASESSQAAATSFDADRPVDERITALENAVSIERHARQLLQEEVLILNEILDEMREPEVIPESVDGSEAAEQSERDRRGSQTRDRRLIRSERLVGAGFTESEAQWILHRESELQMEALQTRYDARRAGESVDYFGSRANYGSALRQELGDAGYERYLEANGRPTQVAISSVFEGSPALAAGLQPGDQIMSYDGRRVFSMDEITALTMQGQAGENVVVDISRDGTLMQLAIPRGPLGVTGGRRYRR